MSGCRSRCTLQFQAYPVKDVQLRITIGLAMAIAH